MYTVVWEIFACKNFRMLKFRMGKFSYNNGCSKFERAKRDFRFKIFLVRYVRKEQGVHAKFNTFKFRTIVVVRKHFQVKNFTNYGIHVFK